MDWSGDDRVNVCERVPEAEERARVGLGGALFEG